MGKKLKKITEANISFVSLVPKGANGKDFLVVKGEQVPDVTIEVPILKTDQEKRIVTGVVYEPNVVDSQGDFMTADAIEKAAYAFMENHQNIDIKHNFQANKSLKVVESYIVKADTTIEGKEVKAGTWMMSVKIGDDAIWEGVKKGEYNGFSMGGTGKKEEVSSVEKDATGGLLATIQKGIEELLQKAKSQNLTPETAKKKITFDFKSKAANERIRESTWALRDGIGQILLSPEVADKKDAVGQYIDSYKEYVLNELSSVGIQKMSEEFVEKSEGDEKMNKQEVEEIVKQQLSPLMEQMEKIAKAVSGEESTGGNTPELTEEEKVQKAAAELVEKQFGPVVGQLQELLKMRGIPYGVNQTDAAVTNIQKTDEEIEKEEIRGMM